MTLATSYASIVRATSPCRTDLVSSSLPRHLLDHTPMTLGVLLPDDSMEGEAAGFVITGCASGRTYTIYRWGPSRYTVVYNPGVTPVYNTAGERTFRTLAAAVLTVRKLEVSE